MLSSFINGFLISIGLIVAIGAQNIYVLKRGLLKESVFAVALTCSLIDAALIIAGVKGLGKLLEAFPQFIIYITWFGIIFLIAYGVIALKSTFSKHSMKVDTHSSKKSTLLILATLFSLSFLNPHVYLDTVILIGTIGSKYVGIQQNLFVLGATAASIIWFFALAYGSRVLIPLFKQPITWKYLDFFTALVMFFVAYTLYDSL
ncbi:LysE/ArgO family amino acid transporter [Sulfurospirillum arcachonense]|uniref:LysE/ArgO family amino acid transporter n=1 Tax=Sulfurospirillum arcachonense TaxID=57666 RepID=UPI0004B5E7A6|nr:LysE/ArgO family amino acid transporter [Sulfurospirillum arcachonense]